ncbi:DUF6046 domain-containing protein [Dysgonomonas sp. ZJ279]|uniref:DUF6046 domain-containing protein n=1 Tax=Dysgonomonas sp. ZJ279 TaxID=2709796 RepID=UPI0013EA1795|nr:DUF6046 domain-containing protein [Dysgonomonas sp. ZJ279]
MTGEQRNKALFVADAIRNIFGINSPIYIPWGTKSHYYAPDYPNIELLPEEEPEGVMSEFGTPVFGSIIFEGGEYNMYNRITGAVEKGRHGDYTLPYSCIVEFSRDANLTKTEVLGSTGSVKELYGIGDWRITIRGIAMNRRNGSGPTAKEQIETLVRWSNVSDSIGVQGSIFRGKGIYNIVIESLSIQPIVGRWNAIPFQIEALSDEPIEFYNV